MSSSEKVMKGAAAAEPESLHCPRCDSTNTKFCYYNNYNLSQPRYFCKACRRYWTRGGSLRNIPVGGGSRKNAKRSRSSSSTSLTQTQTQTPTPTVGLNDSAANYTTPIPVSFVIKTEHANPSPGSFDMNLNEALPGSFSSLLGSQQPGGFLGLGGYSLGLGSGSSSGFDMLGFGFGPPMVEIGGGENANGVGGSSGGSSSGCNTWNMDGGLADAGDCFGWPELAISTPGTASLE